MTSPSERHAHVVGLGLIGGSLALALNARGWRVSGSDANVDTVTRAIAQDIITGTDMSDDTELVVIAVPAGVVVDQALSILATSNSPRLLVTDVAGIKGSIVDAIDDPRFIGGHPMAGSEQRGLDGSRADLFNGCTWVLTPTGTTRPEDYSRLHSILRDLDANVVALDHDTHDRLVAMASHVPHLVAGALMNEASVVAESDGALLQLAAGGFRDMTRVSAGDPVIWPDVLFQNSAAVTTGLRALRARLEHLEVLISQQDREGLMDDLRTASHARRELPGRSIASADLAFIRVPVPDRPGVLADVTMTASDLNVNIFDIEISHSVEGQPGVILMAIEESLVERFVSALESSGYRVSRDLKS